MKQGLIENGYLQGQIDVIPLFANRPRSVIDAEPGLMLVASRLVKGKGVDFLISALKENELDGLPWRLAIAGEGPEQAALQHRARSLGLEDRVNFLGELSPPELEEWYSRSSFVLSPVLRAEPFGLVGVEAMAHGKPMIAFSGGATEEWLLDRKTGLLVRERSTKLLAKAIAELLLYPELRHKLGTQARERWEYYRPEIFVSRLIESFQSCIRDFEAMRACPSSKNPLTPV
jgi:glycosyltransferase involved in cell wall biosynthesis